MANVIKIKKGLDINLKGKASDVLLNGGKSDSYAIVPDYYNGIVPKVVAKVGEKVKAGSVLMIDKNRPEIKFVSPCTLVCGRLSNNVRTTSSPRRLTNHVTSLFLHSIPHR